MKHTFFTCLLLVFCSSIIGQITLKRTDFAVSNTKLDSGRYKLMTKEGALVPTFGNNQTWNYSTLKDSISTVFTYYFTPASSFGALPDTFKDATLATDFLSRFSGVSFPSREYERLDSTGYYDLGYATEGAKFALGTVTGSLSDTLFIPGGKFRFTAPRVIYKFPMTANSSWKSNFVSTSDFQLTIRALGLNKTPGKQLSYFNYSDTIVGWGTLTLKNPSGGTPLSFAVLLDKKNASRVDSFYLDGQLAPTFLLGAFGLQQGQVTSSLDVYHFLGVGFNEPQFYVSVNGDGKIVTITRAVLPSQGLTVKNEDLNLISIKTTVFPNPTTEGVNFEFNKTNNATWHIMLYNTLGEIIHLEKIVAPEGITTQYIDLKTGLPNGTYFYNLLDENSLIRANGKFVLNKF